MRWTVAWAGVFALLGSGAGYAQEPVSWVDPVGVSISGQTVSKLAPSGWNASAISRQTLGAGDGFVEFETLETNTLKAGGLSRHSIVGTFEDMDFGVRLNPDATFDIVEGGALKHQGGLFYLGDRFKIAIVGATVVYSRNGSFVYQSAATPPARLQFLVALHSAGATIANSVAGGSLLEGVVWTAHQGTESRGNDLQKNVPGGGSAGAVSTRGIVSGDGFVEMLVFGAGNKTVGLSNGNGGVLESEIDFGLRLLSGAVSVVENGIVRGTFGAVADGDVLRISVEMGVVRYWRNGSLLYSSLTAPIYPLLVDATLVASMARELDTTISGTLGDVATPRPSLSVASGLYPGPISVLVVGPPDATLRYTVNGADPDVSDTIVASGASIPVAASAVLRVRAWGNGLPPSGIAEAIYVFGTPTTEAVTWAEYVNTASGPGGVIKVGGTSGAWDASAYSSRSLISPDGFAEVVVGDTAGGWAWGVSSSDGSSSPDPMHYGVTFSSSGLSVVERNSPRGVSRPLSIGDVVRIGLEAGSVVYRLNGERFYVSRLVPSLPLVVDISVASYEAVVRPTTITDVLGTTAVSPVVATPAGGAFAGPQSVTLSTATGGATIRYTLNGAEPTTSSTIYAGPVTVSTTAWLKARAYKTGLFSTASYGGFYAIATAATTEPVDWANPVNAVSVGAGALSYSAPADGSWAGAVSTKAIVGGDGYVEAQFSNLGLGLYIGLSTGDTNQTDTDIDFAMHPTAAGIAIYEKGVARGVFGGPGAVGDLLRIGVENGVVKYRQNGALIYTSSIPPQYPLLVDTSLKYRGTTFSNVVLSGLLNQFSVANVTASIAPGYYPSTQTVALSTPTAGATIRYTLDGSEPTASSTAYSVPVSISANKWLRARAFKSGLVHGPTFAGYYAIGASATTESVVWVSQANVSSPTSGALNYSGPSDGLGAGAISSRSIQGGDGYVEAYWSGLDANLYLGLSSGDSDRTPADIDYAVHLASGGLVIWERGLLRGTFGVAASVGDAVRISLEGGVVKYKQNGVVVYSSTVAPQYPLLVDTSLHYQSSGFSGVTLSGYLANVTQTPTPTFSPAAGTFQSSVSVTISSVGGSTVKYTTDGSIPTASSTAYTGPVLLSATTTLKAMAWNPSYVVPSAVASAVYTVSVAPPTITPASGTYGTAQTVTMSSATGGATIYYTLDGTDPTPQSTVYSGAVSLGVSATVKARAVKASLTDSAITSRTITLQAAAPAISPSGGAFVGSQVVTLSTATPGAEIWYTTDGSSPTGAAPSVLYAAPLSLSAPTLIKAAAFKTGWTASLVASAAFSPTVSAPTFSPAPGNYTASQTVAISCSTPGAQVRYTTDGTEPTTSSSLYAGPLSIEQTTTVRARAFLDGWTESATATATYTLTAIPPTISPSGATFVGVQSVTMLTTQAGGDIHFTVDGSTPSTASPQYTGPFELSSSTTVRAIAVLPGWQDSPPTTADFIALAEAPTLAVIGASPGAGLSFVRVSALPGLGTRCTTDGSEPSSTSPVCGTIETVPFGSTLKVRAEGPGLSLSATASLTSTPGAPTQGSNVGIVPPSQTPGAPVGAFALTGFESVNPLNGNLDFALPVGRIGGRGAAGYDLALHLQQRFVLMPDGQGNFYPQFEWWKNVELGEPGHYTNIASGMFNGATRQLDAFRAPDGSDEYLEGQVTTGGYALSGIFGDPITALITPGGPTELVHGNGTRFRFGASGYAASITDRNGNLTVFNRVLDTDPLYPGLAKVLTVTDSIGRVSTVHYREPCNAADQSPAQCDVLTWLGGEETERQVVVVRRYLAQVLASGESVQTYQQLFGAISWLPGAGGLLHNPLVPAEVRLPNGTSYLMTYNRYGELVQIILPTGARIEYEWGPWNPSADGTGVFGNSIERGIAVRREFPIVGPVKVTRFAPGGDGTEMRHETAAGALLSRTVWGGNLGAPPPVLPAPPDAPAVGWGFWDIAPTAPACSKRVFEATGAELERQVCALGFARRTGAIRLQRDGKQSLSQIGFDRYGNKSVEQTFDFGVGSWGGRLQRIERTFVTSAGGINYAANPSLLIRDLVATELVRDAVDGIASQTLFLYDDAPPEGRAQPTGHDPAYGPAWRGRGNVTTIRRFGGTISESNAVVESYVYDILGNVVSITDPRSKVTTFGYADNFGPADGAMAPGPRPATVPSGHSTFAFITSQVNPAGHATHAQYDYHLGRVVDLSDANGVVTSAEFADVLDRVSSVTMAVGTPAAKKTRYEYDDGGRLVKTFSDRDALDDGKLQSEIQHDGLGRTTKTWQFEGTGWIETRTEYDAMGRAFRVANPFRGSPEHWTETKYDALGRVVEVIAPLEESGIPQAVTRTEYSGNITTVTDPAGKKRQTVADALGRLAAVIEDPGGSDPATKDLLTAYSYDPLANLTGVSQGNQSRTFVYDALSRLRSATNPESGLTTYDYDANGNLLKKTDARNVETHFTYDSLNRVLTRTYVNDPSGTPTTSYGYDDQAVPYAIGRQTSAVSNLAGGGAPQSVLSHIFVDAYDPLGRVRNHRQVTRGVTYPTSYTYNRAGATTSMSYPSGRVVDYEYDAAGRLALVSGTRPDASAEIFVSSVSYAPHGAVSSWTLGNGIEESTGFNARLQPTGVAFGAGSQLLGINYGYSGSGLANNGNVLAQEVFVNGSATPQIQMSFGYDALNRLTMGSEPGGWTESYGYDRFGNRTKSGDPTQFSAANNRIVGGAYDDAGNLEVLPNGSQLAYDAESRQIEVSPGVTGPFQYRYDPEGRRVTKDVAGGLQTTFVYSASGQLLAEYSSDEPSVREHIYAGSKLVAVTSGEDALCQCPEGEHCEDGVCVPDGGGDSCAVLGGVCHAGLSACPGGGEQVTASDCPLCCLAGCEPRPLTITAIPANPYDWQPGTMSIDPGLLDPGAVVQWHSGGALLGTGASISFSLPIGTYPVVVTATRTCPYVDFGTITINVHPRNCAESAHANGYNTGHCVEVQEAAAFCVAPWVAVDGGGTCEPSAQVGYQSICCAANVCAVNDDCPADQVCGQSNICGPCTSSTQCNSGLTCDATSRCVDCSNPASHNHAQTCGGTDSCGHVGGTPYDPGCLPDTCQNAGGICTNLDPGCVNGISVGQKDCSGAQECCLPAGACTSNAACGDLVCEAGNCVPCVNSQQCDSGMVCSPAGRCVQGSGGGCTNNTTCPNGEVCNGQGVCVPYVVGDGVCTPNVESCGNSTTGDCPCPGGTVCSSTPYPGICVECTQNSHCAAGQVCNGNSCISAPPFCGDGNCNNGEDINSCEADCKGDGVCAPNVESCGNSPQDCPCPGGQECSPNPWPGICVDPPPSGPVCSNGQCEAGEDCNSCAADCGQCEPDPGPSCGALGGDHCSQSGSCPEGAIDLGNTYDCGPCCLVGEALVLASPGECGVTMSCMGGNATGSPSETSAPEPVTRDDPEDGGQAAESSRARDADVAGLPMGGSSPPAGPPPFEGSPRLWAGLPRRSFELEFEQVAE